MLFLMGCGNSADFQAADWGMTTQDVVELEEKNGMEITEDNMFTVPEGTLMTILDTEISGQSADIDYIFNEELESIQLTDTVLIAGAYYFPGMHEADSEDMYDTLVKEYGEPTLKNDDGSFTWEADLTNISFNGDDYVSFKATSKALEEHMESSEGNQ